MTSTSNGSERLLELAIVHTPGQYEGGEAHQRLLHDMITSLGMDPITLVIDTPTRVLDVTLPRVYTVYDLLRLFGSVQMVATLTLVVGEPLPIDMSLTEIGEDEVIFLRPAS